ncbi:MAG: lysophospholipid acyltransferase family protein [Pseudomonadota bacterium]
MTAATAHWVESKPQPRKRIYFANHTSNGDFVLIWSALPRSLREMTRPVAGADYWLKNALQRFVARDVFGSVLIDRCRSAAADEALRRMADALDEGASLILFPEGTRNMTDMPLLPFKSGLYHLAKQCPDVEVVPVWLSNTGRVLPKGEIIPVPLRCGVTFGAPLRLSPGEAKTAFLDRASSALLALAPPTHLKPADVS